MRVQINRNFYLDEFESRDLADIPLKVFMNILILADQLQILRDVVGKSINVNSGYRSPKHNKKVGGAKKSQHLKGKAADITIDDMTPDETADFVEDLIMDGDIKIGGLGRYNTFTHIDIRKKKVRWDER